MVKSKLGIFSRLLKSARLAVVQEPPSDIFVGQDKLGNKYFEIPGDVIYCVTPGLTVYVKGDTSDN